jgi:hypothetical protein
MNVVLASPPPHSQQHVRLEPASTARSFKPIQYPPGVAPHAPVATYAASPGVRTAARAPEELPASDAHNAAACVHVSEVAKLR